MAMKEYLALLKSHHKIVKWNIQGESNPSAEIQLVYSAAPADWAILGEKRLIPGWYSVTWIKAKTNRLEYELSR